MLADIPWWPKSNKILVLCLEMPLLGSQHSLPLFQRPFSIILSVIWLPNKSSLLLAPSFWGLLILAPFINNSVTRIPSLSVFIACMHENPCAAQQPISSCVDGVSAQEVQ